MCDELLNAATTENQLDHVERYKDRRKMEQTYKDMTFALKKSKIELERKGKQGCKVRIKKRSTVKYWELKVKNK